MSNLTHYRKLADAALADHKHATRLATEEMTRLTAAKEGLVTAQEAQSLIQEVAEGIQNSIHAQIAKVVTRCIRAVGWDYDFKIRFERKRGRTEARLVFVRDGVEIDPVTASGGGVVECASLGLRIACLLLAVPRRRRLLCLDEPCRSIHGDLYRQRTVELLETLARELDFQICIATGLDWLRVGKVIDITNPD